MSNSENARMKTLKHKQLTRLLLLLPSLTLGFVAFINRYPEATRFNLVHDFIHLITPAYSILSAEPCLQKVLLKKWGL